MCVIVEKHGNKKLMETTLIVIKTEFDVTKDDLGQSDPEETSLCLTLMIGS